MMFVKELENVDVLQQNCKVGLVYKRKCIAGKLCKPEAEFDMIERCKICKKVM